MMRSHAQRRVSKYMPGWQGSTAQSFDTHEQESTITTAIAPTHDLIEQLIVFWTSVSPSEVVRHRTCAMGSSTTAKANDTKSQWWIARHVVARPTDDYLRGLMPARMCVLIFISVM
jgi:hypothetical protein